jgi:zinc transport system substrate-binding protein
MKFLLFFLPLLLFSKTISVSILPQKYIIEQISKDFEINVLIPKASSAVTYSPKPSQLKKIKNSDIYFTIQVPFEKGILQKIKDINPNIKIINMGRYLKRFAIKEHHHKQSHNLDPHLWLSPPHIMLLARATLQELIRLNPNRAKEYIKNYNSFIKKITNLDSSVYKKLLHIKNRAFLVYHPSFGYFAKVYNLKQIPIENEGKEPSAKHIATILKNSQNSRLLIIEPQFPKKSAIFIAKKIGAKVEVIDPLEENITKTITNLAEKIAKYSN